MHTFHIIFTCLWTNMSATLHIYVPLYFYWSLHVDPTLFHIPVKQEATWLMGQLKEYVSAVLWRNNDLILLGWKVCFWMAQFCILIIFPNVIMFNGVTLCKLYRYGLYVCIISETAHHRTTFGKFCNSTQKTIPEENICKMFHIFFTNCTFFLWEGQGCFLEIRIKFHLERAKEGIRGGYGEKPKMRGFFFDKIPIIKQDTNCW